MLKPRLMKFERPYQRSGFADFAYPRILSLLCLFAFSFTIAVSNIASSAETCNELFLNKTSKYSVQTLQEAILKSEAKFEIENSERGPRLNFIFKDEKISLGELSVLKVGTELFHWGSEREQVALFQSGRMSNAQIVERISGRDRGGGGFYVSTSPIDSLSFGTEITVSRLVKDVYELPRSVYSSILELVGVQAFPFEKINEISTIRRQINILLQNAGVASISIATTWKTIIHENALSELKTPLLEQMMNGIELTSAVTNDRIYLTLIGKKLPLGLEMVKLNLWPKITKIFAESLIKNGVLSKWPHYDASKASDEIKKMIEDYNKDTLELNKKYQTQFETLISI